MSEVFEVRQLTPDELPAAVDVANRAFGFGQGDGFEFRRDIPYVWNADRADNTWACFDGGEMIAVVGAYPFQVKMGGVSFRATCVGQVGTPSEHRGKGAMSAMLKAATAKMDAESDFAWLGGDRMRYGRYGWAFGGLKHWFTTNAKYLPAPPATSAVRAMDPAGDGERIRAFAEAQPYNVMFSKTEFGQLLSIRDVAGLVSQAAWVLSRGPVAHPRVLLGDGEPEEIAKLLAFMSRQAVEAGNDAGEIAFETGPYDCPLARAALGHYRTMETQQVGGFRLGDLRGYFQKACRIVEPTLTGGSDEISFRNTDTGQGVRLVCRKGKLSVDEKVGPDARRMTTIELSEVAFSGLPLDTVLPGLAVDSPLRQVFRVPVYVPFGLYAM